MTNSHRRDELAGRSDRVCADLRAQWPEWTIHLSTDLPPRSEKFDGTRKRVYISAEPDDLDWRMAHAIAHLALHRNTILPGYRFTVEQEMDAEGLADLWLDRISADDLL